MKKEIALIIPTAVVSKSSKELNANDKLVFGLHYAYFKKGGKTIATQIKIGELLNLHPNIVSRCNLKLVEKQYLKKVKTDFEVVEDTINQLQQSNGAKEIIIPFEVYGRKNISGGEILLWGEFNRFRDTAFGCYQAKDTIANNIGSSKISITTWTKKLYELQMIYYGEYQSRTTIHTVDFRELPKEENIDLKKEEPIVLNNGVLPQKLKDIKLVEENIYEKKGAVISYKDIMTKNKKKSKKKEKKLKKEEQQYLNERDFNDYDNSIESNF